ncbi:MAG: LysR family transcriptional regulator [Proteobacteria bacterium]|nr:LysR family transcriptional regulator [Pseudomonadota bacterium]
MVDYRTILPSLNALNAFECAARHMNFSRAAEEMGTSQPAVSRHIAQLEGYLGVALFLRRRNRLSLTAEGRRLHRATVAGLEEIRTAVTEIRAKPKGRRLTIACSYDVAHLWLMPRHARLQAALGPGVEIRVVAVEYGYEELLREEGFDLALTFAAAAPGDPDGVLLFAEETVPLCAPGLAERHAESLARDGPGALAGMARLELSKRNFGWADWAGWFAAQGLAPPASRAAAQYSNYVYLLEAACAGEGAVLGWRHLSDSYLSQGRLIVAVDAPYRTGSGLRALVLGKADTEDLAQAAIRVLSAP